MDEIDTTPAAAAVPKPRPPQRINRRALRMLREPFPAHLIGKKPRVYCWDCNWASDQEAGATCGLHAAVWCATCRSKVSAAHEHDDYVGHAEVTDRFLEADLAWTWRPMALDERGLPALDDDGGLWMYVLVGGVERLAYGKPGVGGKPELISNGLKNGAIRFGTALNLWAQTDLHAPVKQCPGCAKSSADPKARFCDGCGYELPVPKRCSGCGKAGHDPAARFCSGCGDELSAADATAAEPEYARPDFIARINSLLGRKRGVHGADRLAELSEILGRKVDEVAHLTPDEARQVVRILSGGPDLNPAPAAWQPDPWSAAEPPAPPAAVPAPKAGPAKASPAPVPPARPAAPAARGKRGGPKSSPRPAPLASTPAPPPAAAAVGINDADTRTINSLLDSRGVLANDTTARLAIISGGLGRDIGSMDELSPADAKILIRGLSSGYFSADAPPAAPAVQDDEPDRSVFDGIRTQIDQAITDEDAGLIKIEIGKALVDGSITQADGGALVEHLEKRGRRVGVAVGS